MFFCTGYHTMPKEPSKTLRVGDFAPDFSLRDQHGELVRLSSFFQRKAVVLYFYPKDDTPGCIKEAKCFRDHYEEFTDLGAEVIGVSSDHTTSHMRFADRYKLPFTLLSDPDGKVRELYGVSRSLFVLPGRVTFVIDKEGIILHVFSSQFHAHKHVDEAIRILKKHI